MKRERISVRSLSSMSLFGLSSHVTVGLLWVVVGALGGALIGKLRNRVPLGIALGAVGGVVGWVVLLLIPGAFRECPACAAQIPVQAATCPKCKDDVRREARRSARSDLRRGGANR
jgi:hypothetical protein